MLLNVLAELLDKTATLSSGFSQTTISSGISTFFISITGVFIFSTGAQALSNKKNAAAMKHKYEDFKFTIINYGYCYLKSPAWVNVIDFII